MWIVLFGFKDALQDKRDSDRYSWIPKGLVETLFERKALGPKREEFKGERDLSREREIMKRGIRSFRIEPMNFD